MTDRTPAPPTDLPAVSLALPAGSFAPDVTRRRVLVTGGVLAAAVAVTAACGSSGTSAGGTGGSAGASGTTVPTGDVPVGGGEILTDEKVVITQPVAGTFKAFTAVCTHQGCLVGSVSDGEIRCPCHGSTYSITDGSVTGGPAPAPLKEVPITVSGSTITLA